METLFNWKIILLKIFLTLLFVTWVFSMSTSDDSMGILKEVAQLGWFGSLFMLFILCVLVAFYCKDLQSTLEGIDHKYRQAQPKSVWLMFLIPYNFIEDFFIIRNVSRSIEFQAEHLDTLRRFNSYGVYSGIGWCCTQILSFLPGYWGLTFSLLTIVLWIYHWRLIKEIKSVLNKSR